MVVNLAEWCLSLLTIVFLLRTSAIQASLIALGLSSVDHCLPPSHLGNSSKLDCSRFVVGLSPIVISKWCLRHCLNDVSGLLRTCSHKDHWQQSSKAFRLGDGNWGRSWFLSFFSTVHVEKFPPKSFADSFFIRNFAKNY